MRSRMKTVLIHLFEGLMMLLLAAVMLGCYRLNIDCPFKRRDDAVDTMRALSIATLRCVLCAAATHTPVWTLQRVQWAGGEELMLRTLLAALLAILQPIGVMIMLPDYRARVRAVIFKYSQNTKRTWQSARELLRRVESKVDTSSPLLQTIHPATQLPSRSLTTVFSMSTASTRPLSQASARQQFHWTPTDSEASHSTIQTPNAFDRRQ